MEEQKSNFPEDLPEVHVNNVNTAEETPKGDDFWSESAASRRERRKKPKNAGLKYMLKETLTIIISAVIIAMVLKTFIVDTRLVPSLSMYPTVDAGDRLILNKLAYISKTPQRGDIVVFEPPAELATRDDLLKRVIGLPGDVVEIHDGYVFINGAPLEEYYLNEKPMYIFGPLDVPENYYLMLGDNRNLSVDSHIWENPFISADDIYGRAVACYWPLSRLGKLN